MKNLFLLLMLPTLVSCRVDSMKENTFKDDVAFLKKHTDVVVLADQTGNTQIAVCPGLQGRIMTSTAGGDTGQSYGWINYELLESGENNPHINAFGGEERLWFGPEGGQYSVFFKKGDPFDLEHWYTPTAVNEESFAVKEKTKTSVRFVKEIALRNEWISKEQVLELAKPIRKNQYGKYLKRIVKES